MALDYCLQKVRREDPVRYQSALFLPRKFRQKEIALLALNLELAAIPLNTQDLTLRDMRFQWWQDALEALPQGEMTQQPVLIALKPYVSKINLKNFVESWRQKTLEQDFSSLNRVMDYACNRTVALWDLRTENNERFKPYAHFESLSQFLITLDHHQQAPQSVAQQARLWRPELEARHQALALHCTKDFKNLTGAFRAFALPATAYNRYPQPAKATLLSWTLVIAYLWGRF